MDAPNIMNSAFAIYTWNDGKQWTATQPVALRLGQSLEEAAEAAYTAQRDSMQPARLVSVEVIYKGRRAKRVA